MRSKGFEPLQALSYEGLNLARLTTPATPHFCGLPHFIGKLALRIKNLEKVSIINLSYFRF